MNPCLLQAVGRGPVNAEVQFPSQANLRDIMVDELKLGQVFSD